MTDFETDAAALRRIKARFESLGDVKTAAKVAQTIVELEGIQRRLLVTINTTVTAEGKYKTDKHYRGRKPT